MPSVVSASRGRSEVLAAAASRAKSLDVLVDPEVRVHMATDIAH